jgi:hypothetical protein
MATSFGCKVRAFDPRYAYNKRLSTKIGLGELEIITHLYSMNEAEEHRRGDKIFFYRSGLGSRNEIDRKRGWRLHTLGSYMKMYAEETVRSCRLVYAGKQRTDLDFILGRIRIL